MLTNYPNLELLEYKTRLIMRKYHDKDELKWSNFNAYVFPQTWGSTALGFDGAIGGQAMTKAYTTVFHLTKFDEYYVYFNERIAYVVDNPSEEFLEDLKNCNLKSVSKAKTNY